MVDRPSSGLVNWIFIHQSNDCRWHTIDKFLKTNLSASLVNQARTTQAYVFCSVELFSVCQDVSLIVVYSHVIACIEVIAVESYYRVS
jgi:hypothetical protein